MAHSKEIQHFLDTLSDKVEENVQVITPDDLGQDYLLHISTNPKIKEFVPRIGERQAKMEDRTVPRICTADTIYGCLIGYGTWLDDILYFRPYKGKEKEKPKGFKQGYYIHKIKFDEALKPNKKMVYDAEATNECWLVSYSKNTSSYTSENIGKFFISDIHFSLNSNKFSTITLDFYVEIKSDDKVKFSKNIVLSKGYWKLAVSFLDTATTYFEDKDFRVFGIERKEFDDKKNYSAAMLSDAPAFMQW